MVLSRLCCYVLCRKKKKAVRKVANVLNKIVWVVVILLVFFVIRLHSHKKNLATTLDDSMGEKHNLKQRVQELQSTVSQKTRDLREYQRLHGEVSHTANKVGMHDLAAQRRVDASVPVLVWFLHPWLIQLPRLLTHIFFLIYPFSAASIHYQRA